MWQIIEKVSANCFVTMTVLKTDLAVYCDKGNIWSPAAAEMPFWVHIILIDSGASMGPNFFGPRASLSFWYQARVGLDPRGF